MCIWLKVFLQWHAWNDQHPSARWQDDEWSSSHKACLALWPETLLLKLKTAMQPTSMMQVKLFRKFSNYKYLDVILRTTRCSCKESATATIESLPEDGLLNLNLFLGPLLRIPISQSFQAVYQLVSIPWPTRRITWRQATNYTKSTATVLLISRNTMTSTQHTYLRELPCKNNWTPDSCPEHRQQQIAVQTTTTTDGTHK